MGKEVHRRIDCIICVYVIRAQYTECNRRYHLRIITHIKRQ